MPVVMDHLSALTLKPRQHLFLEMRQDRLGQRTQIGRCLSPQTIVDHQAVRDVPGHEMAGRRVRKAFKRQAQPGLKAADAAQSAQ